MLLSVYTLCGYSVECLWVSRCVLESGSGACDCVLTVSF